MESELFSIFEILASVHPGFCGVGVGVIDGGERKLLPALMVGGPASSSNLLKTIIWEVA